MRLASTITLLLAFLAQAVLAVPWGTAEGSLAGATGQSLRETTCRCCRWECDCGCRVAAPTTPDRPSPPPESPAPNRRASSEELTAWLCPGDVPQALVSATEFLGLVGSLPAAAHLRPPAAPLFLRGCALLI